MSGGRSSKLVIGITGGIGSGKSAVSAYLKQLGEKVIDADLVARQIVRPGEKGSKALRKAFGDEYFKEDGELDRGKLARHVFADSEALIVLNSILHPLIKEKIIAEAKESDGRVFIDAALLIQIGLKENTDYIWLVVADTETRIQRVMDRDGLSREDVLRRISTQFSDDDMKKYADAIIDNSDGEEELRNRIDVLLKAIDITR